MGKFASNIRSFFIILFPKNLTDIDIDFVREYLSKPEQVLFYRMPLFDQRHGLNTAYTVREMVGKRTKIKIDKLYKAALLHDVGKVCVNLSLSDRVRQTLMFAFLKPLANYLADRGAANNTSHFRKIMYCRKYHPQIGAQLAREINVDDGVVYLIEHHQDDIKPNEPKEVSILREADNLN